MNNKKQSVPAVENSADKKKEEEKKDTDIEGLKRQLEECGKLKNEYLAGWQRERADFLNYKKEEMERIESLMKYAIEGLVIKILPILDNFEITERNLPDDLKKDANIKGVLQIKKQIQDFLKNQGVEEIDGTGKKFNPDIQEVIEITEAKDKESGMVLEEVQKGYKINGRLLRPAKVKVAK